MMCQQKYLREQKPESATKNMILNDSRILPSIQQTFHVSSQYVPDTLNKRVP